jgi:hypothetical protein
VDTDSAGGVLTDSAGGVLADLRVVSADAVLTLSLNDGATVNGLIFFAGPVDDECPEPDGFFSDLVVDTSSLAASVSVS